MKSMNAFHRILTMTSFLLMASAIVTRLDSGIDIEESVNDFGTYMSVYNREIVSPAIIIHEVRNEVHCRWIQFTLQAMFTSVFIDNNSSNIECRTADGDFYSDIKVLKKDGATTFIRTEMKDIYWPSKWGLFYHLQGEIANYSKQIGTNCVYENKRRSPVITRKESEKDIVMKILQDGGREAVWVGAFEEYYYIYKWLDNYDIFNEVDKVMNKIYMRSGFSITFDLSGTYVMENSSINKSMICVLNIFDIEWNF